MASELGGCGVPSKPRQSDAHYLKRNAILGV